MSKELDIVLYLARTKDKPFFIHNVKEWISQYDKEEITLSRFVELLNIEAYKWKENKLSDHAKSEMEAFVKWWNDKGYTYNHTSNDFFKYNKNTRSCDWFIFSDLYELYKQSKQ